MVKINLDYLLGSKSVYNPLVQPGEIWQVSQTPFSPLEFSEEEQDKIYSETAKNFLQGQSSSPYVLILQESEFPVPDEEDWQIVSVMVVSPKIENISDVDLIIPASISGFSQDLLIETWNTTYMLTCNLTAKPIAKVPENICQILREISIFTDSQSIDIQSCGLIIGEKRHNLKLFHQKEMDWADVLIIPVKSYWKYHHTFQFTEYLLNEAAILNQELIESEINLISSSDSFWNLLDEN